jgi:hypothetical protein
MWMYWAESIYLLLPIILSTLRQSLHLFLISSSSPRQSCQSFFNCNHRATSFPTRVFAPQNIATMSGRRDKRKIAATSSDDEEFSVHVTQQADAAQQVDTSRATRTVRASTHLQTKAITKAKVATQAKRRQGQGDDIGNS